jgi:type II secretory pathway component PulF
MPMLMAWMLSTADRQGSLIATLRVLAEIYRTNATRRSRLLKTWLPVLITLFVTGTIGLAYGLAFILPLRALFFGLTQE